jgi:dihydrofolate synthase/folylpolyglutamate synthase
LEAQGRGLAAVRCTGRIERFRLADGTEVILDTSHNVESISALCDFLRRTSAPRLRTVIFGTSKDKPYAEMLAELEAIADRLILTRYHGNPRFRETGDLLAAVRDHGRVSVEETPLQALRLAQSFDVPPAEHQIVICGSFFLAAELLPLIDRS